MAVCEGHIRKAQLNELIDKFKDIDGPQSFSLRFAPYGKDNQHPPCLNRKNIEVEVEHVVIGHLPDDTRGIIVWFTSTALTDATAWKKGNTVSFKLTVRTKRGERAPSATLLWDE